MFFSVHACAPSLTREPIASLPCRVVSLLPLRVFFSTAASFSPFRVHRRERDDNGGILKNPPSTIHLLSLSLLALLYPVADTQTPSPARILEAPTASRRFFRGVPFNVTSGFEFPGAWFREAAIWVFVFVPKGGAFWVFLCFSFLFVWPSGAESSLGFERGERRG